VKQGVALTGRNRAVSAARPPTRPAGPPAGSVTDDDADRRQTPLIRSYKIMAYRMNRAVFDDLE